MKKLAGGTGQIGVRGSAVLAEWQIFTSRQRNRSKVAPPHAVFSVYFLTDTCWLELGFFHSPWTALNCAVANYAQKILIWFV